MTNPFEAANEFLPPVEVCRAKLYRVAGRRRLYTLAEALALANEIAAKTGIIVSVEGAR